MKISAALLALASATSSSPEFDQWKSEHSKTYLGATHDLRYEIFQSNKAIVEEHNAKNLSWTMALNQFADLTPEEFGAFYFGYKPSFSDQGMNSTDTNVHVPTDGELPAAKDWRGTVAVGPVKNQQSCGSCWAFSTIVSVEGQLGIKNNKYTSMSEQNLVDCVKGESTKYSPKCCMGCSGGLMANAFAYVAEFQQGGIDTEASYPYTAKEGSCKFNRNNIGGRISGYTNCREGSSEPKPATKADEDNVKDAVANVGPVSIAVNANLRWQLYSSGIFTGTEGWFSCKPDPAKANHGVALVGYGAEDGEKYWVVRNSWGGTWGEEGYMRLPYGKNACGLANFAVYPNL